MQPVRLPMQLTYTHCKGKSEKEGAEWNLLDIGGALF